MWSIPPSSPRSFRQALPDSFPGAGDVDLPIDPANWMIITDGMAAATDPCDVRHGCGLAPAGRRLRRQDRHGADRQPRGHQAHEQPAWIRGPTDGLSASFPGATRSSSSPYSGSTATGAQTRPSWPRRWPRSTSTRSGSRTTTSCSRPARPSQPRWARCGRNRCRPSPVPANRVRRQTGCPFCRPDISSSDPPSPGPLRRRPPDRLHRSPPAGWHFRP